MSINIKPSRKGLLHKKMGVGEGKPISGKALATEKKTAGPVEKKEIVFAENARKWHHSKKPEEVKTDRGTFAFKKQRGE